MKGKKHNWLLYGSIIFSLFIHILIILYIADLYKPKMTTKTEFYLRGAALATESRTFPITPKGIKKKSIILPNDMDETEIKKNEFSDINRLKTAIKSLALLDKVITSAEISRPSIEKLAKLSISQPFPSCSPLDTKPEANKYDLSNNYLGMVRLMIERQKRYPAYAKKMGIKGKVTVIFIIRPDGHVSRLRITKSSGHKILDRAAIAAIKNASPFPKPPAKLFKTFAPLKVTIVFELI